jgi:hypothetical protein
MPVPTITRRSTPPPELPPFKFAARLDKPVFGDWRDELVTKGYAVVKAVPREKALEYREECFKWLESFPLGFDRNDVSTWKNEHLPVHVKGGMFHGYGYCHEKHVSELAVVRRCAAAWLFAHSASCGTCGASRASSTLSPRSGVPTS